MSGHILVIVYNSEDQLVPDQTRIRPSDRSYGKRMFEETPYNVFFGYSSKMWVNRQEKALHVASRRVGSLYQPGVQAAAWTREGVLGPFLCDTTSPM